MQILDQLVIELTLEDVKDFIFSHWVKMLEDKAFREDLIRDGFTGLDKWSKEELLSSFIDLGLCEAVREHYDESTAVIVCRVSPTAIADLSTTVDNEAKTLADRQSGCPEEGCDCCSGHCTPIIRDSKSNDDF
jgi:hypothetical protein